jgi:hypothetical protein
MTIVWEFFIRNEHFVKKKKNKVGESVLLDFPAQMLGFNSF